MGNRYTKPKMLAEMCSNCGPGRAEGDRTSYCICPPVGRIVGMPLGQVLRQHRVHRPDGTWGFEDCQLVEVLLSVDSVDDAEVNVQGCEKCGALYLTDLAS